MGYTSYLTMKAEVKDIKIFKKALKEKQTEQSNIQMPNFSGNGTYLSWHLEGLEVNEDGTLELIDNDWYKWYESEEFIEFLLPFCKNNSTFLWDGEDGESWGCKIKNGKIIEMIKEWKEV